MLAMYLCVRGIDFASFCDFSIKYLNCSDSVEFVVFELFRQCSIFELFRHCLIFELFRQCGIFELVRQWYFWTVPTVLYLLFLNCSDSVVFVVFELFRECGIFELFRQCGIFELFRQCGICCFVHFMVRLIFICSLPNINQLSDTVSLEPLVFLAFLYFLL